MEELTISKFLKEKSIDFEIKEFPIDIDKGVISIASYLGIDSEIIVKTLVYKGKSGEFYICLVGGNLKIHSKKLKKVIGEKDILFASPEEILEVTGYEIGAIPPFNLKTQVKTLINDNLEGYDKLYVGSGKYGYEVVISPSDLKNLTNGEFVDITKEKTIN